ncbi:hypothetical protein [Chryseobacterium lathyri]|uniref:Uncharacterized protein n=1 Tax=Chryseobacterium lathyri TaxID=395933 RepID=A0A511Y7X9_9FLAO|nr:hypothetical protein [Chryseobacterium lathyri]GEN71290.1 hypothetical protein CLA01_13620 [Chryseobacterium lathyri]
MEIDLMEMLLEGKHSFEFQDYCERYFDAIYGIEFQRVASYGSNGDGGKDGYIPHSKEYFAISSRSDVKTKIRQDFVNCVTKNYNVEIFNFVTNRISTSDELAVVDKLRMHNPNIKINVITHKHIAAKIMQMPSQQIRTVLCRSLDFQDDNTVFFKADEKEKISFPFSQSVKDSYVYYLIVMTLLTLVIAIGIYYILSSNEWVWKMSMMSLLCALPIFLYFYKEKLKKTKFPHKILYLILGEKLPVEREVLFDEQTHISIRRNGPWHFTFNKRSADCIKKGCCGKVYLYRSEEYNLVGRCENDKINHVYKVDGNFYGDLLS